MHHSAVGYALGKLMQVMGILLLVPATFAFWDYRELDLFTLLTHAEVPGFLIGIVLALIAGTILVVVFKSGRELQGLKDLLADDNRYLHEELQRIAILGRPKKPRHAAGIPN